MSYATQAEIAKDMQFHERIAACLVSEEYEGDPMDWVEIHKWKLALTGGWDRAYREADKNRGAGLDEAAITDEMIQRRVRELLDADIEAKAAAETGVGSTLGVSPCTENNDVNSAGEEPTNGN